MMRLANFLLLLLATPLAIAQSPGALPLLATSDRPIPLAPGTYLVPKDLTIEDCICPAPGAVIRPGKDVTIKLRGGFIADPLQHVFDISGGGKFAFVPATCGRITPQHFGASGSKTINATKECQAAIDAALEAQTTVYFPAAHYLVDRLRAGAPSRWIGDGKHKSNVWASPEAEGVFIEDTGNPVAFSISEMAFFGIPGDTKVTDVIKLGFNDYPWGSGAIIDNVIIYNFPGAIGLHLNQNISKVSNVWTNNLRTGIRAIGNGLSIEHTQICASLDVSVDLQAPARVFDLEIEAPLGDVVMCCGPGSQSQIFGLHLSLGVHNKTLLDWEPRTGCVHGLRVDLGPSGSFDWFMDGAANMKKPTDFTFDPLRIIGDKD